MFDYEEFLNKNPIEDIEQKILTDPEFRNYVLQQQERAQRGRRMGNIRTALQQLANVGYTAAALRQINLANRAAQRIPTPQPPPIPRLDPDLTQALYRARRGTVDPTVFTAQARNQITDAYLQGLQAAQNLSGGQAGIAQASAQAANIARMQALQGLAPIEQEIALQNEQLYGTLLQQRLQERQNQQQAMENMFNAQQQQANLQAQAVGMLGATGNQNLYQSIQNMVDTQIFDDVDLNNYLTETFTLNNALRERQKRQARLNLPAGDMIRPGG